MLLRTLFETRYVAVYFLSEAEATPDAMDL
jgi:hypothetical protein